MRTTTLGMFISLFLFTTHNAMEEREQSGFIFEKRGALQTIKDAQKQADLEKLRTIVTNEAALNYRDGYYFITNKLMKGERNKKRLPILVKIDQSSNKKNRKKIINQLAQNYKIHLMPRDKKQLFDIIQKLLDALATNKKLQTSIKQIKVLFPFDYYDKPTDKITQELTTESKSIMPIIVIYPASGKKNAQYVLNTIYHLFEKEPGLNITPRFNAKVTDLIYFAQGDADYKGPEYAQYYEGPEQVYYKHPKGKTDYHLRNPAKK